MFAIKTNKEIGKNLRKIILNKYVSVRQFCKSYLDICKNCDSDDPQQMRNISNRFSQILNGKKAIQTYDLPVISELLDVSCEDILSCGDARKPLNCRRTNYNIAFSNNPVDWKEHLSMQDCIAAYADEFGKTVLDYAIEFKNYPFIKYLIENDYIRLVNNNPGYMDAFNFGAKSFIEERPYQHRTLEEEFYDNELLRAQILALAIENNDLSSLKTFRAREVPPQLVVNIMNPYELSFSKYFDDSFNKALANSSMEIFEWFLEDYTIKVNDREEVNWIYPFISELACECIKLKEPLKIQKILNAILTYNKKVFEILHATYLTAARRAKEMCYPESYENAFKSIGRDYHLNQEKNFVCLWPFFLRDINPVALNFVQLKCSSKDLKTQTTIDSINEYYDKIINLPNSQIKNS